MTCWTFFNSTDEMWDGKQNMRELTVDISDGTRTFRSIDSLLMSAPLISIVSITNNSPHLPAIDAECISNTRASKIHIHGYDVKNVASLQGSRITLTNCLVGDSDVGEMRSLIDSGNLDVKIVPFF